MSLSLLSGEEAGEAETWVVVLADEIAEVDSVEVATEVEDSPPGAKGIRLGALLARLPMSTARKLVEVVYGFALRTGRTVEASIGGDSIKITGASREQQDLVIDAWLARHPAEP